VFSVEKRTKWLWAAVAGACLAGVGTGGAAVVKTSFGVSATVVATCRLAPGRASACARSAGQDPTIVAEQPLVTFSRDPKTGATVETVEF
jgi:hypothetical protein